MGTLYLVRHGQASFGADDYDQLSELGHRQSVRLGEYFAERDIRFDGLIAGTHPGLPAAYAAIGLEGVDSAQTPANLVAWLDTPRGPVRLESGGA